MRDLVKLSDLLAGGPLMSILLSRGASVDIHASNVDIDIDVADFVLIDGGTLRDVTFTATIPTRIRFVDVEMHNVTFKNLHGEVAVRGASLFDLNFDNCTDTVDLESTTIEGLTINNTQRYRLSCLDLRDAVIRRGSISGLYELTSLYLQRSKLYQLDFNNSIINIGYISSRVSECKLSECTFTDSHFYDALLVGGHKCQFKNIKFVGKLALNDYPFVDCLFESCEMLELRIQTSEPPFVSCRFIDVKASLHESHRLTDNSQLKGTPFYTTPMSAGLLNTLRQDGLLHLLADL